MFRHLMHMQNNCLSIAYILVHSIHGDLVTSNKCDSFCKIQIDRKMKASI